jgi:Zn-dependent alcohol dehydrogenase
MTTGRPTDERQLAAAVRQSASVQHGLRTKDRDRIEVAAVLDAQGVCHEDIATVCGIQPRQVPDVLAGKAVR